jgi:hypothetical protein
MELFSIYNFYVLIMVQICLIATYFVLIEKRYNLKKLKVAGNGKFIRCIKK